MNYREINQEVMLDTKYQYETNNELMFMVKDSIAREYVVFQEENVDVAVAPNSNTKYIVSRDRSLDEARKFVAEGKKVAVLNFANNHSVGGAPFAAGAQEESMCRMSTLYPCLEAMKPCFYNKHIIQYTRGEIDHMGNDDLIYTPDVCVFKEEINNGNVIRPEMMKREDWYKVDIITCAAPELWHGNLMPDDYVEQITRRIKRILDVAAKEKVGALILGAWGCGAFKNPADIVARVFHDMLKHYNFETVSFALGGDIEDSAFYKEFCV